MHAEHLTFLVVERDVLVADDLVESLSEFHPDSTLIVCRSIEDAQERLEAGLVVDLAVIGVRSRDGDVERLLAQLDGISARRIMMSDKLDNEIEGRQVTITRPFVTSTLRAALERLLGTPGPVA
ncbi:hypothetical protein SAMN04490244_105107 [Tranquillimonas rosea]|uniref:Response regulatory domain-containing protein n=2 Tax=Tranquillimonas rosea TaxID=641238 RepID=A0A1H9U8U5_9RHOB|nr:hypothetical protein SAMN04490244_105107 [Tranquillimonas rosea]